MPDSVLKVLINDAEDERVVILRRADGLITYRREWRREGGWDRGLDLGHYDSSETAENEARGRTPWLIPLFH